MSSKFRLTFWITMMVLALLALLSLFLFFSSRMSNANYPAGRLVDIVDRNANDLKSEKGLTEWHRVTSSFLGVFCMYYTENGQIISGALPDESLPTLPFQQHVVRIVRNADGVSFYVYDSFVLTDEGGRWVRGVVSTSENSSTRTMSLIVSLFLLPGLLIITVGGGWLIAWGSFRPIDKILKAADSISDGDDLSARLNIDKGPAEIRRLGAAFDRMFARLDRSFHAEKQFASDVSHELRTPITIILAECDRAKRKCVSKEDFQESLSLIGVQAQNMSELTTQLLSLTRMQHGTDRYPLRVEDLSAFVESCCSEYAPQDSRGIRLKTEISKGVKASFHSALMSRVIFNLLQNAYRYGTENGQIVVRVFRDNRGAVLQVSDNGIGIAPEDMENIWLRFWQGEEARECETGNGLGLPMVREIVKYHGGLVSVDSKLGQGSTFTVILP